MPITMHHEGGNVFRFDVSGMLRKAELDTCQAALAAEIRRIGPVRLLFLLDGFEGWDERGPWNDLTFYVHHGASIERIAIVGEERWRSQALMFAGADLRRAPVEFFAGDVVAARVWLGE